MLNFLKDVELSDVWLILGLTLLAIGLWQVSAAAALAAVGVVLVWIGLPPRPPFMRRS
jgi:uncharacterized membrane protein